MGIKIKSFGGLPIWFLRKHYSVMTSKVMLTVVSKRYDRLIRMYIKWFLSQEETPLFQNVMIETINRCNGICSFCPANRVDESRPFMKMSVEIFQEIIDQLKNLEWKGKLFLCVNNEPFIDNRILEFAEYAKENLKGAKTALITNGTLIDEKKLAEMPGVIDQIVINDYSEKYVISEKHKIIFQYIKRHEEEFKEIDITINRRYTKEILSTRAGSAPNKKKKNNKVNTPCIYPFTDLVIFPDGQVGICCNDCAEKSHFGDITKEPIVDIWSNRRFEEARKALSEGRSSYEFCYECDVVDAGERETYIKKWFRKINCNGLSQTGRILKR